MNVASSVCAYNDMLLTAFIYVHGHRASLIFGHKPEPDAEFILTLYLLQTAQIQAMRWSLFACSCIVLQQGRIDGGEGMEFSIGPVQKEAFLAQNPSSKLALRAAFTLTYYSKKSNSRTHPCILLMVSIDSQVHSHCSLQALYCEP